MLDLHSVTAAGIMCPCIVLGTEDVVKCIDVGCKDYTSSLARRVRSPVLGAEVLGAGMEARLRRNNVHSSQPEQTGTRVSNVKGPTCSGNPDNKQLDEHLCSQAAQSGCVQKPAVEGAASRMVRGDLVVVIERPPLAVAEATTSLAAATTTVAAIPAIATILTLWARPG